MKTKELIRQLQEADPSGELECCVGNADIHFVDVEPAYWDGCLQVLKRDESNPYYNIIGGKYTCRGDKVNVRPLSIGDAIFENQDLPVEFEGKYGWDYYKERVEHHRKKTEEICNDVEGGAFIQYAIKRFTTIWTEDFDEDEVKKAAIAFYKENLDYRDEMPKDIAAAKEIVESGGKEYTAIPSWNTRRMRQWDREITMDVADGKLVIKKV
jgi:hypothetical protein